jgi:cysteinyl-tRNA synthetase, unknown class
MASNGIYVLQGINPTQIAAAPVGAKVVDLYADNGNLFSTSDVSTMESGGGAVLGYFDVGEAENFRSYFSSLPSSVLGPQNPDWPGDFQVQYWTPTWLAVAENYIQTMINQGYNGAFLDVVSEAETSWAQKNAPASQGGAEGAMITLVEELAAYARAKDPNFQIWINAAGAEPMLANSGFVSTINGAFEEELFYQDNGSPEPSSDVSDNLKLLDNLVNAGKPVVAVEYVTGAATVAAVQAKAAAAGIGYYIASPNLQLDGVDTEGFAGMSPPAPPSPPSPPSPPLPPSPPASPGGGSSSGPATPPTVTITGADQTVTSATQKIIGTVDVADAGSTVHILDGSKQIGTATVAPDGSWSTKVTLPQGANVLTATDTNATGTGTSNSVTYTLQSSQGTSPVAPTLIVADSTLSVTGGGGKVPLGISVTPQTRSTTVTITGLSPYETITDRRDHKTFSGNSITLTAAEVNSGLKLTSNYQGSGDPTTTLTITASNTTGGVTSVSAAQTITITDPPPSAGGTGHGGHALTSSGAAALLDQNAGHFTGSSPFGGDHTFSGPDIAPTDGFKSNSGFHG